MNLKDIILTFADEVVANENYINPGHNGPYYDEETLVRNVSHWVITLSNCYKWTQNEKYKNKIEELVKFLQSSESIPFGYTFYHRKKEEKDKCNGLVGQAWTIEALCEAKQVLENDELANLAYDVFLQHRFNKNNGLWNIREIDGSLQPIDPTFNHQLWFAAAGALIKSKENSIIRSQIKIFLDKLDKNLTIYDDGLIYHPIDRLLNFNNNLIGKIKFLIKLIIFNTIRLVKPNFRQQKKEFRYKSAGYHCFNTYAFALLKQSFPEHKFWSSDKFKKVLQYLETDKYKKEVVDNKYSYAYNAPGFEVPFTMVTFDVDYLKKLDEIKYWMKEQFKYTFDHKSFFFSKNNEDPNTLTARIYEASRLPVEVLEKVEIEY